MEQWKQDLLKQFPGWDEFCQQQDEHLRTLSDDELKSMLSEMAKDGLPKPEPGTVLGDALVRFTTDPIHRRPEL